VRTVQVKHSQQERVPGEGGLEKKGNKKEVVFKTLEAES